MKITTLLTALVACANVLATNLSDKSEVKTHSIKLNKTSTRSEKTFDFGTGDWRVKVDSKGVLVDGITMLPVMGEIHYSRMPEETWYDELLKMKAGGINVAATYVFWNHHEAVMDQFDFTGNKNLRKFIETAKKAGLYVVLRVGPFCHGEVWQGGFPDWLVCDSIKLRSQQPAFMARTGKLYREIAKQVEGLMGDPIIGVQIENESRGPWPYLKALKDTAIAVGLKAPFYTRTGWPKLNGKAEFGQILPLYGDYADGFWDRKLTDMPGEYADAFIMKSSRLSAVIATETFGQQSTTMNEGDLSYPYLTCELGGGMMPSYHRRINIFEKDALALEVCKVASGSNLPGFYMYHGGTNPIIEEHSMAESQNSNTTNYNDMPYVTYDFQSPIGEMGQINESFYYVRRFNTFLMNWGGELSNMDANFPETMVNSGKEDNDLRWTVRSDGERGYVFINNYQRMSTLTDKKDIRFDITTASGRHVAFPSKPITIKNGETIWFPFGIEYDGVEVEYATAMPYEIDVREKVTYVYMAAVNGIDVEIKCKGQKVKKLKKAEQYTVKNSEGKSIIFNIMDEASSLRTFKTEQGVEILKGDVRVVTTNPASGKKIEYAFGISESVIKARQTKKEDGLRIVEMGKQKVASMPTEKDFDKAAVWEIGGIDELGDNGYLEIRYRGDVARVYADGKLVEDNFWNGKPMLVRTKDIKGKKVELKILPLGKDYPIYLQKEQRDELEKAPESGLINLDGIKFVETTTKEK